MKRELSIDYRLVRKRVKNICIRVTGASEVVVSAPLFVSENRIKSFVSNNETKIIETLENINKKRFASYPAQYADGDVFLYLGKKMRLKTVSTQQPAAVLRENELIIRVPDGCDIQKRKTVFERWVKRQAYIVFLERAQLLVPLFPHMKDNVVRLNVKNMLSRWGSINTTKNSVSLTVHLLRCDLELIDYVITHELCHLAQRGHSKAFYTELEKYYPDRKKLDKRLCEYGLVDF